MCIAEVDSMSVGFFKVVTNRFVHRGSCRVVSWSCLDNTAINNCYLNERVEDFLDVRDSTEALSVRFRLMQFEIV